MDTRVIETYRTKIEHDLEKNVLPFWIHHAVDRERGGFVGALSDDLIVDRATTRGASPAALGNRIAERIIRSTIKDGSLERKGYRSGYEPVNEPLIVELPGTVMNDPNRWQPLALEFFV